jgi:FkbM family methyltransferase
VKPERRRKLQQGVADAWLRVARTGPGGRLNLAVLHLGLSGLGYNHYLDADKSGEAWFVSRVLPRLGVRTAADVGANVGTFSEMLLDAIPGQVWAFEPGAAALPDLRALAARSGGRLTVFDCAIGDSDTRRTFFVSEQFSTWSSLHPEVDGDGALALRAAEPVTVRSLDSLIDAGEIEIPDFIKIDIEGSEYEALSGARDCIASRQVSAVQFEFNAHQLAVGRTLKDLAGLLPGYQVFRLTPGHLDPIPVAHWTANIFQYCNMVAVREDLVGRLPHPGRP